MVVPPKDEFDKHLEFRVFWRTKVNAATLGGVMNILMIRGVPQEWIRWGDLLDPGKLSVKYSVNFHVFPHIFTADISATNINH